jgi:glycosyltransferase involved in cell wall biosynthesis
MGLHIALTSMYSWPEVHRGAERYVHELGGALVEAGHRVRILSTDEAGSRDVIRGVEVHRVRRRSLLRRRFGDLAPEVAFGAESLRLLGSRRLDVWHAMGTADGAAAATAGLVRPGLRSVFTDHGFPNPASRRQRRDHRLHEHVVRRIDRYICVSDSAGSHLRLGYRREPDILSGGVDVRRFAPAPTRERTPTVLFVADADEKRKNLPLLLESIAHLRRAGTDVRLWVAGPGDQRAAFDAAPDDARAATELLGVVDPDALHERYRRAWVTALPAHAEAFGLVLVESLASGTPIVALDEGGPAEIVERSVGRCANATPEDIARACAESIELAATPSTAGTCHDAAKQWDWRTSIVPRMEEIYGR